MDRETWLKDIQSNIEKFGCHITYVIAGISPQFAYTIGLSEQYDFELVFAGGIFYNRTKVGDIVNGIADILVEREGKDFAPVDLGELGTFSLTPVDTSWSKLLMLGVYDYYKTEKANAFQIIPDEAHFTLDIPDMTQVFSIEKAPVWQWMVKEWEYNVSKKSDVGTDIYFLMGWPLTQITRWEDNYWEMYHQYCQDVERKDIRIVSLATMLAIDPSILPALELPLEGALLRENVGDEWEKWNC